MNIKHSVDRGKHIHWILAAKALPEITRVRIKMGDTLIVAFIDAPPVVRWAPDKTAANINVWHYMDPEELAKAAGKAAAATRRL